ncbi:MAG TPA: hypothetical protein VEU98_01410 [Candidatus Eremiobacteraceae bacterium]|nr:hypothetical protein [Candidatus Eremiobacteraceae bacterium]
MKRRDDLTCDLAAPYAVCSPESLMRGLLVLLMSALLTACATQPNVGVGGQSYGRAAQGGVRVGVPF